MSKLSTALLTAKRYADGGDIQDNEWANIPRTPEGIPRIAITPKAAEGVVPKPGQVAPAPPSQQEISQWPSQAASTAAQIVAPNIYQYVTQPPPPIAPLPESPDVKAQSTENPYAVPAALEAAGFIPGPETFGAKMAAGFLPAIGKMFGKEAVKDIFTELAPEEVLAAKKIGEQGGSSPGGTYTGFGDGRDRYVKVAKSEDHAKNEKLASMLYRELGIPGAEVELTRLNGKPAISSPIIPGKQLGESNIHPDDYGLLGSLQRGLPADQWLANYDVIGLNHDNIILDPGNTAHRIDFGGALLYRAQGKPKTWWGPEVKEFESMHDPNINENAAHAFTKPGTDEINDQARQETAQRIAALSDDRIRELVNQYGPGAAKTKEELANDLIARRDQVAEHYGVKPQQAPPGGGGKIPYTHTDPSADAYALLYNHTWNDKNGNFHSYDTAGIAKEMYQMASEGGQLHVDEIYKHLPQDMQPDVNATIDYLIKQNGHDPWDATGFKQIPLPDETAYKAFQDEFDLRDLTEEDWDNLLKDLQSPEHQAALAEVKQPAEKIPTLMQLNKTHSANQLVQSLKDNDYMTAANHPATITPKQLGNIHKLINAKDAGPLAQAMSGLSDAEQTNIYSWMNQKQMDSVSEALSDLAEKKKVSEDPDQYEKDLEDYYQAQEEQSLKEYQIAQGIEDADSPIKGKKFISQTYYDALKPLKWETYKPKAASGFTPLDITQAEWDDILGMGFNPNVRLFHGSHKWGSEYPQELYDPKFKDLEHGFFLAHDPWIAQQYGPTKSYVARAPKAAVVDWSEVKPSSYGRGYASHYEVLPMHNLIKAAHEQGYDMIVVDNMYDIGSQGKPQTQYVVLNPSVLRAPTAKFDPKMLHKAIPLAGVVGGTTFTYGMLPGEESAKGKMARGGKIRKYTMPLKKGSSPATVSQNISEFHTGPTYQHTAAKFGKATANKQAIAAALSEARRSGKKKAMGGPNLNMENMVLRGASYGLRREGMINSSIPGRTDKLPMNVKAGSYILPADIPSALGQGNSAAGGQILKKMFSSGPYGLSTMRGAGKSGAPHMNMMRPPRMPKSPFAKGGEAEDEGDEHVPIIAAGGEFILHPDVVRDIGHGNIKAGHRVLDKFVRDVRKKHIETLKKLPGPKR